MANNKKEGVELLNYNSTFEMLNKFNQLDDDTIQKNNIKSQMITFEGCQALVADSLEEAEKQYRVMFDEFVEEWGEQDNLEWAYVVENDYDDEDVKSYDLIVKEYFVSEDLF